MGDMICLLREVPIFAGMDDIALHLLLERSEPEVFAEGAIIVQEGERGNRMFVIEEGSVRIVKNHGSPLETELAILNKKDFFGEMCILNTLPRSATVQALTPVTAVSVNGAMFHRLYKQRPDQYSILILNIARDLSRRLCHVDELFASRH